MSQALNLKQVRCFVAVAEELNFRVAAERLHMTQPPLTRQIKRLEETLKTQLFERDRKGVRMTDAGERFLLDARTLLQQADDALVKFQSRNQGDARELNIGVTTVVDTHVFQSVMSSFRKEYSGIRINVVPGISINLIKEMHRGRLDVALLGLPSATGDLVVERLFTDPLVAALPSDHRLARKRRLALADLAGEAVFWFDRKHNPVYYDDCQRTFKALSFSPRFIPEPRDHHVLLGLIAADDGIGLIPSSLKSIKRNGVIYKPLVEGDLMSIGIGVAYRAGTLSAPADAFVRTVRRHYDR